MLVRHGFGELLDQLELLPAFSAPRRLLRREGREVLGAPQRLRLALEELGPTFVKLGQILSTRPDLLPPAYIEELSRLQDAVPPAPWPQIQARIESELGMPLAEAFAEFDREPIAAASLAQVHGARLRDGSEVVVKVQRPGIRQVIETDLEILQDLAQLAQNRTALGEIYDLPEIAEDFAATLRNELDYRREGRNADRFRRNFAEEPLLYIPKVYWDYTTENILVLERIHGIKINDIDALEAAGFDCSQIALNAAHIIIKEVLEDGFFHADPHPGNFVVMPGHVIGAMDFGMVGHLDRQLKEDLVRLYIVSVRMDSEGIIRQLVKMGAARGRIDRERLRRDLTRLLTKYRGLPLREIRAKEVVNDIMPIAFRHHLHFPPDLWLLGKTLAMMEGLALQLDPDFDIFAVSEPYVRHFLRQLYSPTALGKRLAGSIGDWNEFLLDLPRRMPLLLDQLAQGETRLTLRLEQADHILNRLDRLTNRLAISVLTAAFIVSLALLFPTLNLEQPWRFTTWLIAIGFAVATLLGLWLLISIWRSGRR